MNERLIHLQIKIKSLAAEALIIRAKGKNLMRLPRPVKNSELKHRLDLHRTTVVRLHARSNQLAYGLLRGIPYEVMERKCHTPPQFTKIHGIARRFGGSEEVIKAWIEGAKAYINEERYSKAS